MEQVIYGDLLFAVNFSMDMLSLYVAGRAAGAKMRPARMCAAAALGALYATATPFVGPSGAAGAAASLAVAAVICLVAYVPYGVAALVRRTALFFAASLLLGGAMSALYALLGRIAGVRYAVIGGAEATVSSPAPFSVFALAAAAVGAAAVGLSRLFAKRRGRRRAVLEICFGGRTAAMRAVCDSGNLARDPLGGEPVIFVSRKRLRELLPPPLARAVTRSDTDAAADLAPDLARSVRVIPLGTVSGRATAVGFLPGSVRVDGEEKRACVACLDAPLPDGCEAILPAVLI